MPAVPFDVYQPGGVATALAVWPPVQFCRAGANVVRILNSASLEVKVDHKGILQGAPNPLPVPPRDANGSPGVRAYPIVPAKDQPGQQHTLIITFRNPQTDQDERVNALAAADPDIIIT